MKCPCKDCKKRHLACHDSCPEYKAWLKSKRRNQGIAWCDQPGGRGER